MLGDMRLIAVTVLVALSGCAAIAASQREQEFTNKMRRLRGKPISDTMAVLGIPTKDADLPDGRKLYEWSRSSRVEESGSYASVGGRYGSGSSHSESYDATCVIRATTREDGIVQVFNVSGNDCW